MSTDDQSESSSMVGSDSVITDARGRLWAGGGI